MWWNRALDVDAPQKRRVLRHVFRGVWCVRGCGWLQRRLLGEAFAPAAANVQTRAVAAGVVECELHEERAEAFRRRDEQATGALDGWEAIVGREEGLHGRVRPGASSHGPGGRVVHVAYSCMRLIDLHGCGRWAGLGKPHIKTRPAHAAAVPTPQEP